MPRRSRRWFLSGLLFALLALLGLPLAAAAEPAWTAIGYSQGGIPLVVHHLGSGPVRLLVLGGQHGGPEMNTIELVDRLRLFFTDHPEEVPARVTLDLLVSANPDGATAGTRQFLSGVDPTGIGRARNGRQTPLTRTDAFASGWEGQAQQEQETRALRDWVMQSRPVLVINYHSAGGFMFGSQSELVEAFAEGSRYYRPAPGGGERLLNYRVTGGMNFWLRDQGIPGILVELTSPTAVEFDRNLAALRAVLARLAG